jgi:hypothetical protein
VADEQVLTEAEEELRCMRVPEALRLFNMAEEANHDPDLCAGGRWTCHMLSGNFELAWRESDAITGRAKPDPNRFWDGRPFVGRNVLVRCLHGLGDTIQFSRYIPLIREKARTVAIEAQPELKLLLKESHIADEVFTWGEPEPYWDQQMEVVELPRIFRTTVDSIPNGVPYLDAPSTPCISPCDGSRVLRVGIVWASSSFNPDRSLHLEQLTRIFAAPAVRFYSVQAGSERRQLQACSTEIVNLYDETACVLATAKALKTLDLLITVDTMVAHLAGALARPVWTLLPFECDWRWMLDREDSPWYPTMRLFRQPKPSDWNPVIERVQRELDAVIATKTGTTDYRR